MDRRQAAAATGVDHDGVRRNRGGHVSLEMIVALASPIISVGVILWRSSVLSALIEKRVGDMEKRMDDYRSRIEAVPLVIQRVEAAERQLEKLSLISERVSDIAAKLDVLIKRHGDE